MTSVQLLGYPRKLLGITAIGKVGGIKIESAAGQQFFLQVAMEIREKWKFFAIRPLVRKRREIFRWAIKGEKAGIHSKKWLRALFDSVLLARSWELPVERELPSSIIYTSYHIVVGLSLALKEIFTLRASKCILVHLSASLCILVHLSAS